MLLMLRNTTKSNMNSSIFRVVHLIERVPKQKVAFSFDFPFFFPLLKEAKSRTVFQSEHFISSKAIFSILMYSSHLNFLPQQY